MALIQFEAFSEVLGKAFSAQIALPETNRGPFPVLWLLHGAGDNHTGWLRHTAIERQATRRDLALVAPAAGMSMYEDMAHGQRYFTHIADELPALLRRLLPLSAKREDNFIAGLSMGGTGTLVYALNHPERFAAAAVLSCCPFQMGFTNDANLDDRSRGMVENRGGLAAFQASYENTWGLVDKLAGSKDLPRFYFAIGKDDFLYESYKTFKAHAKEIGFDATFEEFDGYKHEWRFWDLAIQDALDFFGLTERGGNPY